MTATIFSNTPLWVWILFVFLLKRGISALQPRKIPLNRLFIIPVLFLSAGIYHLNGFHFYPTIFTYMITSILSCIIRTSLLWGSPVEYDASSGLVTRTGSPFVLVLILLSFVFKFTMTYLMETDSMLLLNFSFQCLWGAGLGVVTGLSWGCLLYMYTMALLNKSKFL
ncbi:hypothetical protein MJO48_04375 [Dickeya fangzhongdai]|uniref:hypothetical protein n=1 Tax=Dickeya fangzhongdai TaxID=1778540 RepID=UPI001EFB4FCD|nr:hypothetical protein [Dickeya fangzhongdai]ULR31939.1 hypothetical protein MJO48_04375 [Dickeya fangzhongdai]